MAYATVAEARTWGLSVDDITDTDLTALLNTASIVVDNYAGISFSPETETRVYHDVRSEILYTGPIASVTAVSINDGAALGSTAYSVEPWGLRLYSPGLKDADGWPIRAITPLYRRAGRRGNKVSVTATFGYASVPAPVKEATLHITRDVLMGSSLRPEVATDSEGNASVLPIAAMDVEETAEDAQTRVLDTTGSLTADRLLAPYRASLIGVG